MKEILDNKVTLNPIELCSELANKRVFEHYKFFNSSKSEDEIEDMIMFEENGVLYYKEDAQDMFNDFYDEYWTIIEKLAI